ncbi:MAG TPA: hypothetical protein VHC22_22675 [Pirellulales bacterium]|nr:hypothetical protein [Pirellulales bacterium]
MALFISFTEKAGTQGEREIFVNADHIVRAHFIRQSGDLEICLTDENGLVSYRLHGQDATDAVNTLRSLKH